MKKRQDIIYLTVGTVALFIIIFILGAYVRTGGSEILLATSLAALPTGFTIIAVSYMLRNAGTRIQLLWCIVVMILIRSVQLWKPGIDFQDEMHFIKLTQDHFQQGRLSGYLLHFPVNILFAALFMGLYSIWSNLEAFELLVFFVYPLCVIGYYFMAKEITKLYGNSSTRIIPAIMFFPFVPIFCIILTYYWPQLLGLAVLFFSCAALLRLLSSNSGKNRYWVIAVLALSTTLVFTHPISTALFILTIFFLGIAWDNRAKRKILLGVGFYTFALFAVAQFDFYSSYLRTFISSILGDTSAQLSLQRLRFPDLNSVFGSNPIVTIAHTGLFIVVGSLILLKVYRLLNQGILVTRTRSVKRVAESLTLLYKRLDSVVILYFGFGVISFIFTVFFGGAFFDPLRMLSWASLFALPIIIPRKKTNALFFMVILLFLFFLLIWTVWSPWGSPFGSSPNLN